MGRQRLFIAAALPDALRAFFAENGRALRRQCPRLSLTKPENLHLTLHFIGEVTPHASPSLQEAFAELDMPPPGAAVFSVGHYGFFSRPGGKLLWAGLDIDSGLSDWQRNLGRVLTNLGHTVDSRPWKPHITLARRVVSKADIIKTLPVPDSVFAFSNIALYESRFTPQGMVYNALLERAL